MSETTVTNPQALYISSLNALDTDGWSLSPDSMRLVAANRPEPLIEGLLPSKAVVTLAGQPGIGKSFVCLSLAAAVACDMEWFGLKTCQPQYVAYVLGEGFSQFGHRVKAWEEANGPLGGHVRFIDGAAKGIDMCDPEHVDLLIEKLKTFTPGLVILDTFAMLARVMSENDNSQVAQVYRAAQRIVSEVGSTVVIVHHLSKDAGKVRGATAFRGNSDTVIIASKSKGEDQRGFMLSTRGEDDGKQRDGQPIKLEGFEISSPGLLTRNVRVVEHAKAVDGLEALMQQQQN